MTAILTDLAGGVSALVLDFSEQDLDGKGLDALLADVMLDIAPLSLASANADTARAVLDLLDKRGVGDVPIFLNLSADDAASMADLTIDRTSSARLMTANGAAFHAQGAGVPQELGWMLAELTEGLRALKRQAWMPPRPCPKLP